MALLQIVYGLDQVFFKKAVAITDFNSEIQEISNNMLETLYHDQALGMAGNMVGILKQIIVVDLQRNNIRDPFVMLNPEIIHKSEELSEYEESSLSFPGVKLKIKRPKEIKVKYNDLNGNIKEIEADGLFSTVLQHELDYLNAITIFDHVSKLKKNIALKKMKKHMENNISHVHSSSCNH